MPSSGFTPGRDCRKGKSLIFFHCFCHKIAPQMPFFTKEWTCTLTPTCAYLPHTNTYLSTHTYPGLQTHTPISLPVHIYIPINLASQTHTNTCLSTRQSILIDPPFTHAYLSAWSHTHTRQFLFPHNEQVSTYLLTYIYPSTRLHMHPPPPISVPTPFCL